MTVVGIDHVQLAIPPNSDALARKFYGELMGFVEIPKPEALRVRGGMWFQAGPVQIHLGIEDGMRASAKAHPALVVSDLELYRTRLVEAGFDWRDADDIPDTRRAHVKDPFGNRIELIQR